MPTALLERPHVGEAAVPGPGEITNAELARRLDGMSQRVHNDLAEISRKLDAYVLREVYASDQQRREDQVKSLDKQLTAERVERDRELDRIRAQVKWLWSAVIMPVAALLISIWMQAGR